MSCDLRYQAFRFTSRAEWSWKVWGRGYTYVHVHVPLDLSQPCISSVGPQLAFLVSALLGIGLELSELTLYSHDPFNPLCLELTLYTHNPFNPLCPELTLYTHNPFNPLWALNRCGHIHVCVISTWLIYGFTIYKRPIPIRAEEGGGLIIHQCFPQHSNCRVGHPVWIGLN